MMNIEIKDVRIANLVRDAVDEKVNERKQLLHTEVTTTDMADMTTITEVVADINALNEISDQINVKIQFPTE